MARFSVIWKLRYSFSVWTIPFRQRVPMSLAGKSSNFCTVVAVDRTVAIGGLIRLFSSSSTAKVLAASHTSIRRRKEARLLD